MERETALGLAAGEPLIHRHDGNRCLLTQGRDECLHARGLIVGRPIKSPGQSDDNDSEPIVFGGQARDLGEDAREGVGITQILPKIERGERSREDRRCVTHRKTNPPAPDVDPKRTRAHTEMLQFSTVRRRATVCFLLLVAAAGSLSSQTTPLPTPDRARTEALARRAGDRLQTLRAEADRLAAESRTLLGDLRKLELDRQIRAEELKQIAADQKSLEDEVQRLDAEALRLEGEAQAEVPVLRQRLVDLYKLGSQSPLRLMLSTTDFRQLGRASRTVSAMAAIDQQRVDARRRRLDELKSTRTSLTERRQQLATLAKDAERAQAAAARAVRERDALVKQIDERRDLTAELAGELQAAQQRVQALLKSPGVTPVVLPLRPFQGDLDWPVAGNLRQGFNPGRTVRPSGIEITAPEGRPVRALHEGVVAFAGGFEGFGTLVIIEHDPGNFSLYGDLMELNVARNDRIDRGQVIGSSGTSPTGLSGLYFELRVDGRPVDPLQWLKRR